MRLRIKKYWWIVLILIVLYLVIGAIIPFVKYKNISAETKKSADSFLLENEQMLNQDGGQQSCDRVMLLEKNRQALEERVRLLDRAEERIILSTFDMRPGEASSDIAAVLLHKAESGVKVSILVDGFNGSLRLPGNTFFYVLSTHPNIEIRLYSPLNLLTPWTSQGRMHDKYLIVDDFAYILGGRNTFDYFLGEYPEQPVGYDREVLVYNTGYGTKDAKSSLYQVEEYFQSMWDGGLCEPFGAKVSSWKKKDIKAERERLAERYDDLLEQQPQLFSTYDYEATTYLSEGVMLLSGENGRYGKEPVVFYELCELMKQADSRVLIHTPYVVCNSYMNEELKKVGDEVPEVTLMLNSVENGDNFCASSDYLWNKEKVVNLGFDMYEYDGGSSYHGKTVVIDDDISIIGSYNFDLRSTYVDTELMLVVKSKGLTAELAGYMEEMEEQCRKVVSASEYEMPQGLKIDELSFPKRILMKGFGLLAQPFRYLL